MADTLNTLNIAVENTKKQTKKGSKFLHSSSRKRCQVFGLGLKV